jgi:hypothetical protein
MKDLTRIIAILTMAASILLLAASTPAQDPGWPRQTVKPGGILVLYQPQVDEWKDFTSITWRQAFQFTPTGGKQVVGAMSQSGTTSVDNETHMVLFYNINVLNTYFPSLDPTTTARGHRAISNNIPIARLMRNSANRATIRVIPRETLILRA